LFVSSLDTLSSLRRKIRTPTPQENPLPFRTVTLGPSDPIRVHPRHPRLQLPLPL